MGLCLLGDYEVGKSTLAKILAKLLGYEQMAFATGLRELLISCGAERELVYAKPTTEAIRAGLKFLANSMRELRGDDYFCKILEHNYQPSLSAGTFVIEDLRWRWEYEFCRGYGGKLIAIGESSKSYHLSQLFIYADARVPARPNAEAIKAALISLGYSSALCSGLDDIIKEQLEEYGCTQQ